MMSFNQVRAELLQPPRLSRIYRLAVLELPQSWLQHVSNLDENIPSYSTGARGFLFLNERASFHLLTTQIHIKATLGSVSPHLFWLPSPTPYISCLTNCS